jgi:antirestriction protein
MRVYVGTYTKYNNSSIAGAWLDLSDYADKDDFISACIALHKDEVDPELMFQDWEDIPEKLIGESWISEEVWELAALTDDEKEIVVAYLDNIGEADIKTILERFLGRYDKPSDYAYDYLEESGELNSIPEHLRGYFDYEAYARDLFMDLDYIEGMVFDCNR